jgi:hypothetical protein
MCHWIANAHPNWGSGPATIAPRVIHFQTVGIPSFDDRAAEATLDRFDGAPIELMESRAPFGAGSAPNHGPAASRAFFCVARKMRFHHRTANARPNATLVGSGCRSTPDGVPRPAIVFHHSGGPRMFLSTKVRRALLFVTVLAVGTITVMSSGSTTQGVAAAEPFVADAGTDSMLVLVELRDVQAIQHDYDVATMRWRAAGASEGSARLFRSRAATRIKIKEAHLDALDARRSQAKSENDDALRQQIEGDRAYADVEKKLLERREQLRGRDIEFARTEVEYYATEMKAYELELQLGRERARRTLAVLAAPSSERAKAIWELDAMIRDLEGKTLDAKYEVARKQQDLAKRSIDILKARKKVWDAQRSVISSSGNAR